LAGPAEGLAAEVLGNRARPDLKWLSKVTGSPEEEVQAALSDLDAHSPLIGELATRITGTGRSYYAQFPAPLDLFALVRLTKPRTLVESGVASGISSAFMLMGIRSNGAGRLHSIDLPVTRKKGGGNAPWAVPEGKGSGWGIPRALRMGWDLRIGRSEDRLVPLLGEVGRLDFYCHDSPVDEAHFRFEMKAIVPHLGPGSLVVADNTEWKIFERTAHSVGATPFRRKTSGLGAFRVPGDGELRRAQK